MSEPNLPPLGDTRAKANVSARGYRDAFHVHSVLVYSRHTIKPGMRVLFVDEQFSEVAEATDDCIWHAVVDPFLNSPIYPSEARLFWVLLHPSCVCNFRHAFDVCASPLEGDDGADGCHNRCTH
jgi:hypothetical protein